MDKVFVEQLEIDAIIGIYDRERNHKQKVIFDIELYCDIKPAAESDNIDDALNYKTLSDELIELVGNSQCLLIESLAELVAAHILANHRVEWLKLRLNKPDALDGSTNVGVEIERRRAPQKFRPGFMA